jgi:hypothetical protein
MNDFDVVRAYGFCDSPDCPGVGYGCEGCECCCHEREAALDRIEAALDRACTYRALDDDTYVCSACWQKAWVPNKPRDINHKPDCARRALKEGGK